MKKNIFTIIFLLSTINMVGQNKSELANSDLNRFFYNLPIDSCIGYIEKQIIDNTAYKAIDNKYKGTHAYKVLQKEDVKSDSTTLDLTYFVVPIGCIGEMNSPVDYEQWITKTHYFANHSTADAFFKSIKSQLDSLPYRFEPFLKEKPKKIELTYSFNIEKKKDMQFRIIHLNYYTEENKVVCSYRIIYLIEKCN